MSPSLFNYVPLDATSSSPEAEEVSATTVAATAVGTGHHLLKLEGYSLLRATHAETGSYIQSAAFEVGGHTWRIRCYLNGSSRRHPGYVSLFLYLCRDAAGPAAVHAEYKFDLVRHHQGTPPAYGHHDHQGSKPSKAASRGARSHVGAFGGRGNSSGWGWGFSRFVRVEDLERSPFLKDDCFAVRCTVTVVQERTVKEKAVQPHDLARLGMLCKCDDDLCRRHHDRPAAETFFKRFANFVCCCICCPWAPLK